MTSGKNSLGSILNEVGKAQQKADSSTKDTKEKSLPPVHLWNPPLCEGVHMDINSKGQWSYMGSPIGRKEMVKLFSTVLRKDSDGEHYLVTPVEKILVRVAKAPFIVVDLEVTKAGNTACRTDTDEYFELGPEHPLRMQGDVPFITVRQNLEATIAQPCYYRLISDLMQKGEKPLSITSNGVTFTLS